MTMTEAVAAPQSVPARPSAARAWSRALELTAPIVQHPDRIFPGVIDELADRFGDAPNFFTKQVAPFDQKQSGLNGGGPIVKGKAFYFASFEYQKLVNTAHPNTGYPQFDVDASADRKRYYTTGRADIQESQAHRLFARASVFDWKSLNDGVGGTTTISGGTGQTSKNRDLSVGDTWVISSRAVNEVRAGFSSINNLLDSNSRTVRLAFPSAILSCTICDGPEESARGSR